MAVTKDSVKRGLSDSESQTPPPSKKTKAITTPQAPKWTEEEIKKLCDLRKSGMAYKDIVKYFPDRTPKALENCYSKHSQSIGEMFSEEKVEELRDAVENYKKRMWVHIGREIGMSPAGCKKIAMERNLVPKG